MLVAVEVGKTFATMWTTFPVFEAFRPLHYPYN
jgi:hypothetical protein